jgi:hypothetical protein
MAGQCYRSAPVQPAGGKPGAETCPRIWGPDRMRKIDAFITLLFAVAAMPVAAGFAAPAGNALGVNPAADVASAGETRTLVVGADIFIGDRVETGPKGQVQILFADKTELVVGPSSALTIEDYLLRNDGSAGKLAVDMLSGAFRFATGGSAKNRYEINTPTGTIGVRGTEFDVRIAGSGTTRILLYRGAIRFCTDDGDCKDLTNFCELGEIAPTETTLYGDTRQIAGEARDQLQGEFIYAMDQSPLLRQFWFAKARDCLNNPPTLPVYPKFPENKNKKPDPKPEPGIDCKDPDNRPFCN